MENMEMVHFKNYIVRDNLGKAIKEYNGLNAAIKAAKKINGSVFNKTINRVVFTTEN